MSTPLLQVKDLHTSFKIDSGEVHAVNGISFNLEKGKVLGIVGESGSGKSVTAYSILRILVEPGKITGGQILFNGEDIVKFDKAKMRAFRGNRISIIFQDPMTSLNPVYTVGNQLMEAILLHTPRNREEARARAVEMLTLVGVNDPEKRLKQYPHELSGGMRQRVMIAMALACEPDILIADEPTTALDVTIQAQILELMQDLQKKMGMSIIMITHDLGVIADTFNPCGLTVLHNINYFGAELIEPRLILREELFNIDLEIFKGSILLLVTELLFHQLADFNIHLLFCHSKLAPFAFVY